MTISTHEVEIAETIEYGGVLIFNDIEIADQFEDFLSEQCFVFFNIKIDKNKVSFYFGRASCLPKIREIYNEFLATLN
ncbi:hypothetical protein BN873_990009 [Candidatus Competibacter denitrificans Run_A_D11]|uniref:Uncharacterized protein n=1 Tax=Candidatus Competibacter denitrificans Run_A_D11 TaxID=1400863 RepID=W6MEF8_9GAMM|nr:hypothetical protein [Candidatus Competibacter denitrificans]CDI04538.1 hypothetical protein BN873_990009 [Candidatus Competibacter denitrificans Run_A_D11]HAS86619.1 hypothetical protein [Candidatus Competibacteraceae bacterium]